MVLALGALEADIGAFEVTAATIELSGTGGTTRTLAPAQAPPPSPASPGRGSHGGRLRRAPPALLARHRPGRSAKHRQIDQLDDWTSDAAAFSKIDRISSDSTYWSELISRS
jgi:hypothetical protein